MAILTMRKKSAPVASLEERRDQLAAQVPAGLERARQKLKIKTVFAFAFSQVEDDTTEPMVVVGHASGYSKNDTAIQQFIREQVARGNSVGVFSKSEWH